MKSTLRQCWGCKTEYSIRRAVPFGAALFLRPWYVWDSKKRNGVYFRISGMNMKTIFKRVDRIEKKAQKLLKNGNR